MALAFVAIALGSCAAGGAKDGAVWSAGDIPRSAQELNGKKVVVRGWLPHCHRLSCPLFSSQADAEAAEKSVAGKSWISIGSTRSFNRAVWKKTPAEIVLVGRVNADCIQPPPPRIEGEQQVIVLCADRTPDLVPIKILELTPAARPSSETD
jgi:hypothetical protein